MRSKQVTRAVLRVITLVVVLVLMIVFGVRTRTYEYAWLSGYSATDLVFAGYARTLLEDPGYSDDQLQVGGLIDLPLEVTSTSAWVLHDLPTLPFASANFGLWISDEARGIGCVQLYADGWTGDKTPIATHCLQMATLPHASTLHNELEVWADKINLIYEAILQAYITDTGIKGVALDSLLEKTLSPKARQARAEHAKSYIMGAAGRAAQPWYIIFILIFLHSAGLQLYWWLSLHSITNHRKARRKDVYHAFFTGMTSSDLKKVWDEAQRHDDDHAAEIASLRQKAANCGIDIEINDLLDHGNVEEAKRLLAIEDEHPDLIDEGTRLDCLPSVRKFLREGNVGTARADIAIARTLKRLTPDGERFGVLDTVRELVMSGHADQAEELLRAKRSEAGRTQEAESARRRTETELTRAAKALNLVDSLTSMIEAGEFEKVRIALARAREHQQLLRDAREYGIETEVADFLAADQKTDAERVIVKARNLKRLAGLRKLGAKIPNPDKVTFDDLATKAEKDAKTFNSHDFKDKAYEMEKIIKKHSPS